MSLVSTQDVVRVRVLPEVQKYFKMKTKKIDYKSKKWLKGLKKIRKQNELLSEQSKPDVEKMKIRFNI